MKTQKEERQNKKRINFRFYSPEAKEVAVGGDFNNWNEQTHPMVKKDDGYWHKTVILKPKIHEYKFKADNQWFNDPDCPFNCPNAYGTKNNFILVE